MQVSVRAVASLVGDRGCIIARCVASNVLAGDDDEHQVGTLATQLVRLLEAQPVLCGYFKTSLSDVRGAFVT